MRSAVALWQVLTADYKQKSGDPIAKLAKILVYYEAVTLTYSEIGKLELANGLLLCSVEQRTIYDYSFYHFFFIVLWTLLSEIKLID